MKSSKNSTPEVEEDLKAYNQERADAGLSTMGNSPLLPVTVSPKKKSHSMIMKLTKWLIYCNI